MSTCIFTAMPFQCRVQETSFRKFTDCMNAFWCTKNVLHCRPQSLDASFHTASFPSAPFNGSGHILHDETCTYWTGAFGHCNMCSTDSPYSNFCMQSRRLTVCLRSLLPLWYVSATARLVHSFHFFNIGTHNFTCRGHVLSLCHRLVTIL